MKNITMTINPNAITSLTPQSNVSQTFNRIVSISFSVQFDDEIEALAFAETMLGTIKEYGEK